MQLKSFETQVPAPILQRGKSYYHDGAVADLQIMDNGQCFAIVEGNNDYEVDILEKNGMVLSYDCNCPYDGEICKHVVAVLYKLREETPVKKEKEQSPWKKIISEIPGDELRKFVSEYAAKNKDIRNMLMLRFTALDNRDKRDKYEELLNEIFNAAGDRHGFIDYKSSYGAMHQVYDLLAKADDFIIKKNFKEAFYIATAVAPGCISALQNMDDSNGQCGGAIDEAFEMIAKILQSEADISLKNEAFNWLLNEAENPDYEDYGCDNELYPLLTDAADSPERVKRVLAFFDDQIKKVKQEKDGWSRDYKTKNFMSLKMSVLKKAGREEEAAKIVSDNMQIHDFRKIVVENCLADQNHDEAIRLIKEGISIAVKDNLPGIVTNWKEMLMAIYKKMNNTREFRDIVKDLYYSSGRYDMKYYGEYKSSFPREEWPAELDKIIAGHKKNHEALRFRFMPEHLAAVYIEEKMWDELFSLVKNYERIQYLIHYSQYLIQNYATDLIPMYESSIIIEAEHAAGRNDYRQIAEYIRKMSKIPGGKKHALKLVTRLIEKFNKRPAMKDELSKIKPK